MHVELVHESGNWILLRELGFSPIQTVVAVTAACNAYVYEGILKKQKIPFKLISVDVDYEINEKLGTHPISAIHVHLVLNVDEADQEKAIKDLRLIAKNCPVVQSLNPSIEIDETVSFSDEVALTK
ncbi:OsmC family peroxiredoxin [Sporolactobacillus shoreae]|uniref:OsmC family peroxiredoxin n=1 Tax=Sporolactobacillus shoreae TaxID=1465501 RepID=A0A4Z0GT53_9BACL|nr:OsmC family protein [Sporolactobacillus shoreae]TGA99881.1 OsmC family peroxiredoxin [Sporolactobacillus shoreae]